jgi:hypothetical protein
MRTSWIALVCAAACLPACAQQAQFPNWYPLQGNNPGHQFQLTPISSMPVPGTSASDPFTSFDIVTLDPKTQLIALSSRSSKAVTLFNGTDDQPIGETPTVFTGIGADNPHSGPNGNVIAGTQLWAGDYPSTVRVFDLSASLTSPPEIAEINTGGPLRADEMDYDPDDHLVAVTNGDPDGAANPPFVSLISTRTFQILKKVVFDGTNGTPDATQGGIGSVLYDSHTHKLLVSIPEIGSDPTKGAVVVVNPVSGAVEKVFAGIDDCEASGMAQGPGDNVLVGCDPGFPAPDPTTTFAPRTYVINGRTGQIVANIPQVGGEDEVWYNPGDHHYYTGSRDYFTSPTATKATPVLGVIDANTNRWIENIPTGTNAHSVTANPYTNQIFVPLENPNSLCGANAGCVAVFAQQHGRGGPR